MTSPSKSGLDRLGQRLKEATSSEGDRRMLVDFLAAHDPALREVNRYLIDGIPLHYGEALGGELTERWSGMIPELDGLLRRIEHGELTRTQQYTPTGRLKTLGTTVEKLRRESSRLTQVQDLAGTRFVVSDGRLEQDAAVAGLASVFPDTRTMDRRVDPRSGYRAVHVVVRHEGFNVEVQVRTIPQDAWAQLFERLADAVGRQIRYGEPPDRPDLALNDGTVGDLVNGIIELSDVVADMEVQEATVSADKLLLSSMSRALTETGSGDSALHQALGSAIERNEHNLIQIRAELDERTSTFRRLAEVLQEA